MTLWLWFLGPATALCRKTPLRYLEIATVGSSSSFFLAWTTTVPTVHPWAGGPRNRALAFALGHGAGHGHGCHPVLGQALPAAGAGTAGAGGHAWAWEDENEMKIHNTSTEFNGFPMISVVSSLFPTDILWDLKWVYLMVLLMVAISSGPHLHLLPCLSHFVALECSQTSVFKDAVLRCTGHISCWSRGWHVSASQALRSHHAICPWRVKTCCLTLCCLHSLCWEKVKPNINK